MIGRPTAPADAAPADAATAATTAATAADDAGSGSILALGILAASCALTMALVPLLAALVVGQLVQNAADAAALAAADTVSGLVAGYPCPAAHETARLNAAAVTACSVDGLTATVTVSRDYLGFTILGRARAGPPEVPG